MIHITYSIKMKKYALVIASISLVCLMCRPVFARSLALNGDLPRQSPETGAIPVHYAEETELVAVVCHLAGISGYVFNEEDGVLPDYLADVDSTFAGFRDHKAVKFASSKMFRKGFAWDMPMAFALRLRLNEGRIEYNHGLEGDFEDYYYRISRGDEKKFVLIRPIIEALGRRESAREQFPTMRDFLPEYVAAVNAYDLQTN